jgi:ferredoxin-NADP reductase/predicted pyridoxine 5'-phosphate oxidase superfamily flavin-nucleotide-binding protein
MNEQQPASPFHPGEHDIQTRLGVRDRLEDIGQLYIRDFLPDEHREFYEQLPYLIVGSIDKSGRPWASVLVGRPGFIQALDEVTLEINTTLIFGDPFNEFLSPGSPVGVLGIDYGERRRNRLTGKITSISKGRFELKVDQTFGNCPQYIQLRKPKFLDSLENLGDERPVRKLDRLDSRSKNIISNADHFYIATHYSESKENISHGADVSHRGGRPGFVRIEDDRTLTFPDFTGNYHFNTLGNIALNPRAGLLFIDFDEGDLLYLTCTAEIIWDSEERRAFDGAERLVTFTLDEGILVETGMPIRWDFEDYSPSLEKTGTWEEVDETIAARQAENVYQNYTVTKVTKESDVISSFYLEPDDDHRIHCHKTGQYLPIEIQLPGRDETINRTYTISNAPNGNYYRLSIKQEPPAKPGLPPGLSSSYFHDQVKPGSTIRALSPRGQFTLVESSTRSVVLLSGGVGITPMISMLEQLALDGAGCGYNRKVWFIHGARSGNEHAFRHYVRDVADVWPNLTVHFRYSGASENDSEGMDYDSTGHIDLDLLKSLLPFDDYDFYFCGPPPFMQAMYEGLKNLNVADERIHYEFFGPGATLLREKPGLSDGLVGDVKDRQPVKVQFAKSGKEVTWEPSKGTLLELAESEELLPAYSCRSGICHTCSTNILAGDVDYVDPPLAAPEAGQALICCSYPGVPTASDDVLILDL